MFVNKEIKEEIKKYLKKLRKSHSKNLLDLARAVLRGEHYGDTSLLLEVRKISNKQPNPPPNIIIKKRKGKAQTQQK